MSKSGKEAKEKWGLINKEVPPYIVSIVVKEFRGRFKGQGEL